MHDKFLFHLTPTENELEVLDLCKKHRPDLRRLQELVDKDVNLNAPDYREEDEPSALHLAARAGQHEALRILMWKPAGSGQEADSTATALNVNRKDKSGKTALHYACAERTNYNEEDYVRCITMLLAAPDLEVNVPDEHGYTAITYAVMGGHRLRVQALLEYDNIYVDASTLDFGATARFYIYKKFPELADRLPRPYTTKRYLKRQNESDIPDRTLRALIDNDIKRFDSRLKTCANHKFGDPHYATLPEVACAMEDREQFVAKLLQRGCNPNDSNFRKPLLHLAVEGGKIKTLKILGEQPGVNLSMVDKHGSNVLHYLIEIQGHEPMPIDSYRSCLHFLLAYQNQTDLTVIIAGDRGGRSQNSALHLAGACRDHDTVLTLLKGGADLTVMNSAGTPALHVIEPETFEAYLDGQISYNTELIHEERFRVTLDYSPLDLALLQLLSRKEEMRRLFKHPLIRSFLSIRWASVSCYYYANILFYCVFVGLLTTFSLRQSGEKRMARNASNPLNIALSCLLAIFAVREILQLVVKKLRYFMNLENCMELVVFGLLGVQLYAGDLGMADRHVSAITILLAWAELVLLTGRLPSLSPKLEMLKKVSLTFLHYMKWYCLVVLAFALSFYSLFREDAPHTSSTAGNHPPNSTDNIFESPLLGIFQTIVMMSGEYDASKHMFSAAPVTSHLLFLLFVLFVSIVMLNLLNGLAVGDTKDIREEADELSMISTVSMITFMEKYRFEMGIVSMVVRKLACCCGQRPCGQSKTMIREVHIYPNKPGFRAVTGRNEVMKLEKRVVRDAMRIVTSRKLSGRAGMRNRLSSSGTLDRTLQTIDRRLSALENASADRRLSDIDFTLKQLVADVRRTKF
ncbi:transient receptor potential cation channel protein painless-like [Periplaneta americana]|uniref:transient receptor potential cation channel protein painless-like n=1 Tax=Periplaneta americana TaxID=6978 RepID=UPI0037E72FCE